MEFAMKRLTGFTFVEMLVMIGIVALLMSLLLPLKNKARKSADQVFCASNMRQIEQAITIDANNNKHLLVPALKRWHNWHKLNWDDLTSRYLGKKCRIQMDMDGSYVGTQTGLTFTQPSWVLIFFEDTVENSQFRFNLAGEAKGQRVKNDMIRTCSMVLNERGEGSGAAVASCTGEGLQYNGVRTEAVSDTSIF